MDKEGERLFAELQESFNEMVKFHEYLRGFIIELNELDNPQVKSLMDKYEVRIIRRDK